MTQCWLTSQSQKPLSTARSSPANSKKTGKFQESFWLHLVGWIFPRQIHVEVRSYVTPTHWNTRLELHLGKHLYFGTPQQETFAKSKALNMVPKLSNMLTLAFFRKPHPLPKELRNRYRYTHVSIHIYIIGIYICIYIYIYMYICVCTSMHVYYLYVTLQRHGAWSVLRNVEPQPQLVNVFNLSFQKQSMYPFFTTEHKIQIYPNRSKQTPRNSHKQIWQNFPKPQKAFPSTTTRPGHSNPNFPFAR